MPTLKIGPTFAAELKAAGLADDLPFSWHQFDGTFTFGTQMPLTQKQIVLAVYAAHDPTKPDPSAPEQLRQNLLIVIDAAIVALPSIDPRIKAILIEWRKLVQ